MVLIKTLMLNRNKVEMTSDFHYADIKYFMFISFGAVDQPPASGMLVGW